jgi:hypothetical protein
MQSGDLESKRRSSMGWQTAPTAAAGGSSEVLTARPPAVRPHLRAAAPVSVLTLGCVAQKKQ